MENIMTHHVSEKARTHFYVNLASLLPILAVITSGLIIQVEYHMHGRADTVTVLGMDRQGWLTLHKASAVVSLACLAHHCANHWSFIVTMTKKKLYMKKMSSSVASYYLFILFVPTVLTALASWIFLQDHARFMLIEIHDKLALLVVLIFAVHLASRTGRMVRTYRALASERAARKQQL